MAIVIERILRVEGDEVIALVKHEGTRLVARVAVTATRATSLVSKPTVVELTLEAPIVVSLCSDAVGDHHSGIFPTSSEGGAVRLVGRVVTVLEVSETENICDVYVHSGPEFFTLTEEERGGVVLAVGDMVEVVARAVTFHPTNT